MKGVLDIVKGRNDASTYNGNVRLNRAANGLHEHEYGDAPLCTSLRHCFSTVVFQTTSLKFFLLITSVSFVISILFIQYIRNDDYKTIAVLEQEAITNVGLDFRYTEVYKKKERLSNNIKYILEWTRKDYEPFTQLRQGQRAFIKNNCPKINCYVTDNKDFFGGDVTKFDAIAFNGRNILQMKKSDLPKQRSPHQKYIYFNMESADNYPQCNPMFDGFFNLTATYKLNSDILFTYIEIRNRSGEVVGPKVNMTWTKDLVVGEDLPLLNKTKAAAWFVSNCNSKSGRKELAMKLQKALRKYRLTVDIYGKCGPFKCPRNEKERCNDMLEKDYFFYLSFENSFAEDYVTEKLLTALHHNAVPIVYGGANYSRFLPPDTYLDATKMSPKALAAFMARLMRSPEQYKRFFRWKSQYVYSDPSVTDSVCAVCDILNDKTIMEKRTVYDEFRAWWNPKYKEQC